LRFQTVNEFAVCLESGAEIRRKNTKGEASLSEDQRTTIRFSDVTYSFEDGSIIRDDGTNMDLRPQSIEVLGILARNAGDIVSKDTLIANVWPGLNVTDDSLVQCISDIRRAIGEDGHMIIKTIPKKGYRLVASDVSPPKAKQKNYGRLIALAALCVGGLAIGSLWWAQSLRQTANDTSATAAFAVIDRGPSIAVLPFEDLTGEARWERLGKGLSTDVTSELARNKWLFVIAPETANTQLGKDPASIGKALGVRFVTSGTIQAEGETLRISARMTDAENGKVVWAENWTRTADSLFAIQDEMMERIGATLTSAWTGEIGKADLIKAKRKPTESLSAYEHYLIGAICAKPIPRLRARSCGNRRIARQGYA